MLRNKIDRQAQRVPAPHLFVSYSLKIINQEIRWNTNDFRHFQLASASSFASGLTSRFASVSTRSPGFASFKTKSSRLVSGFASRFSIPAQLKIKFSVSVAWRWCLFSTMLVTFVKKFEDRKEALREMRVLSQLNHPNIVKPLRTLYSRIEFEAAQEDLFG